jgi:hypothetical protein
MKKFIILTFLFLFILSLNSMATETRVMTMGDNNNILLDEANVLLYPGRVIEYPNVAIGEFDGDGFYNFGINWKFGNEKPFVVGTFFSTESSWEPDDFSGSSIVPFDFDILDNRRIDLFYGRNIRGSNFGFHLAYFNSGQTFETDTGEEKENFNFYDFTFGLTEGNGKWDLAVNIGTGSWTDEDETGATETEPDGFYNFGVVGRYFMAKGPNYTYIPHAGIFTGKHGWKTSTNADKYTVSGFDVGFGLNYTPSASVLAVCDVGVMYGKWKFEAEPSGTETSSSMTALPYFKLGIDAEVFKWMDLRLGATSYWNNFKDTDAASEYRASFAENDTYLGFGFHWGRLHVDTYTDPDMFLDGFNFISGAENDMNMKISIIYEMM